MEDVTKAKFTVALEPEESAGHAVDAGALGGALLAANALVLAANRALNEDRYRAAVMIRANPSTGSVEVDLEVLVALWDQAKSLFGSANYITAKEILELLGLSIGGGLLGLLKRIRGRRIEKAAAAEKEQAELVIEGEPESVFVPRKVLILYENVAVRTEVERLAETVATPGVAAVSIRSEGKEVERIDRESVTAYRLPKRREQEPAGEPIVPPVEVTAALQPVKVWFEKGNKWQFSDGARTFNADVQDEAFLDDVISGRQRFGHGDVLVVQLRYETVQTPVGLQTNYTVVKVHQVRQAPRQLSLLEGSEPNGAE